MMSEEKNSAAIAKCILGLIETHFDMGFDASQSAFEKPLTGQPYGLSGIELYQLLMLVEEEYGINFKPEDIRRYGFDTINNVVRMVMMHW